VIGRVFLWLVVAAVAWATVSVLFALVWGTWHRRRRRQISDVWTRYANRTPDAFHQDDDLLVEYHDLTGERHEVPLVTAKSFSFLTGDYGGEPVVVMTPHLIAFCSGRDCGPPDNHWHRVPEAPFIVSVEGLDAIARQLADIADIGRRGGL
jgi:hypothetical protein